MKKKEFKKAINVIDLEACCWMGDPPKGQNKEIIEIGIACVDFYTKEIIDSKSIIVKPRNSEISKFCTELTSITQELIDKEGIDLKDACDILRDEFNSKKRMWVSWGDYDRTAFERECKYKGISYPFGLTHVNLKEWFAFTYGLKQAPGVFNALKKLGLEFYGSQHRGVDDAFNTAVILQKILGKE